MFKKVIPLVALLSFNSIANSEMTVRDHLNIIKKYSPEFIAKNLSEYESRSAPKRINDDLILRGVDYYKNELIYSYVMKYEYDKKIANSDKYKKSLEYDRRFIINSLCSQPRTKAMILHGVDFRTKTFSNDGYLMNEFVIKDC